MAAERPITVRDVLTNELGIGMDFTAPWPQPILDAMGQLGLAPGAPAPQVPPGPDEWIRRIATLPLLRQPGERWLYNTGTTSPPSAGCSSPAGGCPTVPAC